MSDNPPNPLEGLLSEFALGPSWARANAEPSKKHSHESAEREFKPRRGDRAEEGMLNGREVQWYRGDVPNEPTVLIREALIELREERVVHVFMRANDAETLARRQQMVLSLPFPPYQED